LVGIEIELDFFSKWLEQISIDPHGVVAIVDTRLNLLARKPALPVLLGKTVHDPLVEAFIASGESHKIFRGASPLDGEDRLYSVRKVEQLPFVIIVGEADADWLAGWRQRAWTIMLVLLMLWGMAFFTLRNHWLLLRQKKELVQLANTDALTGIANRRNFIACAEREFSRSQRHASGLAVLVLDIDRFKLINDTRGHATGDRAIVEFSKTCQKALRDIDLLGRLGGDEFAVLLTDTTLENARLVAERIRQTIEVAEVLDDEGVRIAMTSSIGGAMVTADESDVDAALAKADIALYKSKQQGRNRIEFAE
jgi:diguanylate cyclase (GGDEF)-like protein